MADVVRFVEAVRVVAGGGTVLDPEVVAPLLSRPAPRGPLSHHINSIFLKLGLPPDHDGNRRVLAVLAYLAGHQQ